MGVDSVPPIAFFEHLYSDREFCEDLGRLMLAASQLETVLRSCLQNRGVGVGATATFGSMVSALKSAGLLTRNGEMHFGDLVRKRNYLAHSLFDLFSGRIGETVLQRENLVREDVGYFRECVGNLVQDFTHFVEVVSRAEQRDGVVL